MKLIGSYMLIRHSSRNPIYSDNNFINYINKDFIKHDANITPVGIKKIKILRKKLDDYINSFDIIQSRTSSQKRTKDTQQIFFTDKTKSEEVVYYEPNDKILRNYDFDVIHSGKKKIIVNMNFDDIINTNIVFILNKFCKKNKISYFVHYENLNHILIKIALSYYHHIDNNLEFCIPNELVSLCIKCEQKYRNILYYNNIYSKTINKFLVEDINNFITEVGITQTKVFLNFCHDHTIYYFLSIFNIIDVLHIDTLGFLNIEIWIDDDNKKFYSLEYNNINDEKFYINMTTGLLEKNITYFSGII